MKRTLSLLLALVMVVSMIPTVFATTDDSDVNFDDLYYEKLDNCSPIVADFAAGEELGFVWTATDEGTLTYEVPEGYTMTLKQGEQAVTGTGTVTMEVVADVEIYIDIKNDTEAAAEDLTITGSLVTVCEHVPDEPVEEDRVEATCKVPGSYNSVVYCAVCEEKLSSTAVEIPVDEHAWDEGVKHPATTEKNAYTVYTCGTCGDTKEVEEEGTQLPPEPTFAITTQPTDQHNKLNDTATFAVVAEGAVSYQWQRIKKGATTWSNISGATAASYSVKVSDSTVIPYRCVVKDAEGNELITNEVTIILPDPLVTVMNTPGNLHVIKNTSISFTVELDSEEGVTYQWQRFKGGSWRNVSYQGNKTKTVTFDAASWAQYPFRCEITDANGTKIYAETYTYTLYEPPIVPNINSQPKDVYLVSGGTATFSVVAQGSSFVDDGSPDTGVTYQWWRSKNGGASWGEYTGTGGQTASISVNVYTGQEYLYMCEVKDGYGNTIKSNVVQPHLITAVKVTEQPTVTVVDGTATITFTATGDVKTYQWQRLKSGNWTDAVGLSYVGYNTNTLQTTVKATWRCRIVDLAGNITYTNEVVFAG